MLMLCSCPGEVNMIVNAGHQSTFSSASSEYHECFEIPCRVSKAVYWNLLQSHCENVITVLHEYQDSLLVCGTNAFKPRCWNLVSVADLFSIQNQYGVRFLGLNPIAVVIIAITKTWVTHARSISLYRRERVHFVTQLYIPSNSKGKGKKEWLNMITHNPPEHFTALESHPGMHQPPSLGYPFYGKVMIHFSSNYSKYLS